MKIIGIVVAIIFIFLFWIFYGRGGLSKGYYIPWLPVEYTYKSYSGNIDSRAFYDNVVMKKNEAGMCRPLYTQYKDLSENEVVELARQLDRDAMVERFGRRLGNDYLEFKPKGGMGLPPYEKLAGRNIVLNIDKHSQISRREAMSELKYGAQLTAERRKILKRREKYAILTPYAVFDKLHHYKVIYNANSDGEVRRLYLAEAQRLQKAGGYYFGMAIGVKTEYELTGYINRDVFCEAYYNGCNLYDIKSKAGIRCFR